MEAAVLERINFQIDYLEKNQHRLVIDTDTHPTDLQSLQKELLEQYESTPNYYQGRPISTEELLAELNMAGVDMALSWQNPAAILYGEDKKQNFDLLLKANRHIFESGQKWPDRIIPAGWTDPKALGVDYALRIVDICIREFGFFIVKMNPAQNSFPIDSPEVFTVLDRIVELGGTPAFHYGGDTPYTPAEGLEKIAKHYATVPIVAVHMGGGGSGYVDGEEQYLKTRVLGLKYPNLVFPISAKRDTHIESDLITYQLAAPPFCHNLFCASDAPYGRVSWNFGGFEAMFRTLQRTDIHPDERIRQHPDLFTQEVFQNFRGRNFARFTVAGYKRLLSGMTS